MPFLQFMASVPYANMILFFALYLGVVNNNRLSRFVRFNALNAILVDLLLVVPKMAASLFPPKTAAAATAWGYLFNALFAVCLVAFVLNAISSMKGEEVQLPLLYDAAQAQLPYGY
eukprot:PRCOL_00005584-RA